MRGVLHGRAGNVNFFSSTNCTAKLAVNTNTKNKTFFELSCLNHVAQVSEHDEDT